jgi:hypothetical protein
MRSVIILVSLFCGVRLMAVEPLPLVPEAFLTQCGVYQRTNADVGRELTIQTNKLWLAASAGLQNSLSGSYNWAATPHWFVYVAKDMRVWACDGDRCLILLEADPWESRVVPLEHLKEQPPAAVLERLPSAVRKLLPPAPPQQLSDGGPASRSQSIRSERNRTSAPAASSC